MLDDGEVVYSAVDGKPKSTLALRRLDNVRAHPATTLLVDHYADDWSTLWWIRLDGRARVLEPGGSGGVEHRWALDLLSAKYLPPAVSFLHRGFLRTEAALGSALAKDPVVKVGHQRMARLIRDGAWHRSPFGATLDDR